MRGTSGCRQLPRHAKTTFSTTRATWRCCSINSCRKVQSPHHWLELTMKGVIKRASVFISAAAQTRDNLWLPPHANIPGRKKASANANAATPHSKWDLVPHSRLLRHTLIYSRRHTNIPGKKRRALTLLLHLHTVSGSQCRRSRLLCAGNEPTSQPLRRPPG